LRRPVPAGAITVIVFHHYDGAHHHPTPSQGNTQMLMNKRFFNWATLGAYLAMGTAIVVIGMHLAIVDGARIDLQANR
jgi:hypothetical protein